MQSIKKFNLRDETFIRYTEQGSGQPLLLLHTIRNRLEYSDLLLPYLTKKFKVFVIDLPGHGNSTINKKTNYDEIETNLGTDSKDPNDTPSDQDSDFLPDALEEDFNTDPTNPDTDGDGILDNAEDADILRQIRYDGRPDLDRPWADQKIELFGYHYQMTYETAQLGLEKFDDAVHRTPRHWTYKDYPNLSQYEIFQKGVLH